MEIFAAIVLAIFLGCFLWAILTIRSSKSKKQPNKWRLTPDKHGTYTLEQWHPPTAMYFAEAWRIKEEDAPEIIKQLERKSINL